MVDSVVTFDLPSLSHGPTLSEADQRNAASKLQTALRGHGYKMGEVLGSPGEHWGFSIDFDRHEMFLLVSPEKRADKERWRAKVVLDDAGWLNNTRVKRLAEMKRVERVVHDALVAEGARNIEWVLGADKQRQPQP